MKKLKLFFALFAMLALGVGNAWGAEATVYTSNVELSTTDGTKATASKAKISNVEYSAMKLGSSGNAGNFYVNLPANTTSLTLHAAAWNGKNSNKLTLSSETAGVTISPSTAQTLTANSGVSGSSTTYTITPNDTKEFFTFSLTGATSGAKIKLACAERCLIWGVNAETAGGGETPGEGGGEDPVDPTPGTSANVTYDFTKIDGFSSWGNSYSSHEVTYSDAKVTFEAASKQTSNITDCPVTKGKSVVLVMTDGSKLSSVKWVCKQWTTKTQTITLHYSTNGGGTYTSTDITSTNFSISSDNLPAGTNAVKITFSSTSNQVGISSCTITKVSSGSEEPAASLTANPTTIDFGTKNIYFESEKQGSLEIEVTGQNLTGNVTAAISGNDATKFKLSSSSLTHNAGSVSEKLTVSYEVSEARDYTATLTLSSDGVEDIELPITLKVINEEPATYVKVTNAVTDGEYLIVYEEGNVAFNGALTTLDAISNTVAVEINNNIIVGNTEIDAATFTIASMTGGYSIQSKSGNYIGRTSSSNGMNTGSSAIANVITFSNGAVKVAGSGNGSTTSLQYNATSGQTRFRYFTTTQKAIALYKKASSHTVTIADCTNGSVSAKMGETALATNDQVLSGIQITLSNEAATGYKLAAYDVYKTGDNTTKVTVTDGKFIMPEFDVTISATFELAKTLTGIEITTPATQTTFWQGEAFNHDGLKVTAHFDGAADEDVTDKVTVTGSTATSGTQTVTVSFKEGEVTKTATYQITVKAIPNTKETAYTVADAFDIIDKLGDTDKMYITGFVSQADLEQSSIDQYKNADYWISADGTTNGQQLEAFRGKYLDNTDFTSVNQIMVGDEVIIYGKLTKYGSTYEFAAGNYLVSLKRDKQQPELSYTTTEYNVNLGEAFTAPTLNNPHSLAVTYSSNDEDVATVAVDGAVTIKAAGTVKITASFAGNDDYVAGSASYTINITDPNQLEVTFDATQDKGNSSRGEGEITKSPITFACTDGILGNGSEYRIYTDADATFSAAEGYIITKVVLTSTAAENADRGPGHLSTKEGTYTYSGKVGTWVGEAYTVTLSASAQVRATTITVYYKQDNRVAAGLAWNPATISLTVGDAFTAPTFTNPNNVTGIEFTSSNDALATVSNAGVISLVSGKTGTATITATFAGDATYKPATVTCTITVDHKSEDVVILAKCKDQYYALAAKYVDGKNDVLQALPVAYINGKIYNVATDEQKASITWKRIVLDGKTTFQNGDNYLSAVNSAALKLEEEACDWIFENDMYKIEGADRTILYYATTGGFKNYSTSNMSADGVSGEYSSNAITVAPVFADGDAYHRCTTSGKFGTICLPFGGTITGAVLYECVGRETGKVYLGSVTTLAAGVPYIFQATATELAVYSDGTTATEAGSNNGLHGSFDNDTEVAVGNYILKDNKLCQAADICYVNANRAYIVMSEVPDGKPNKVAGRKYIGMDVQGENVETGVEDLFTTDAPVKVIENGQLIIIRDGVKYNVQGQKL